MHKADLKHDNLQLQEKLDSIFRLRNDRARVNWDSKNYLKLLSDFGNPHKSSPPIIHVAGTNGKGSIIAMLRAILEAQGLSVHVYTSPHLIKVNERIVLSGTQIDDVYLEKLIDQALQYNDGAPISFFELINALAFKAFSDNSADILLLEVGLGGRLDCTNIIEEPLVTIINRISMDHTEYLGDNIVDIAAEKAGIMKSGVPCVIGHQGDNEVMRVMEDVAQEVGSDLIVYNKNWNIYEQNNQVVFSYNGKDYEFPLPSLCGAHQVQNAGAAIAALFTIKDRINVSRDAIGRGLGSIKWQGRLQKLNDADFGVDNNIEIWLDCGHNDSAGAALAQQIQQWKAHNNKPVHLIMGMLDRKDSDAFLKPISPYISSLNIVPIASDPTSQTKDGIDQNAHSYDNVIMAIEALSLQNPSSIILIVGSVYLAGEVLEYIDER